uniref:Isoform 2 of CD209 antigen n=1 Tax=Chlorocebus aethiops TaxID=9534 RepID=P60883-2|nr:dendritic cell-specific ICAM-3 grabbing non-integrin 2 [Chlorocebus aethiops]
MSDSKEPRLQQLGLLGCLGHGPLVLQLLSFTLLAGLLVQVSKVPSSLSQGQSKQDAIYQNLTQLVVIKSAEEQNFLQLQSSRSNRFTWMGLSDLNHEGTWQWVDGSPLLPSFKQYWNKGEPNNIGEEDCAEFSGNGWNDDKCNLAKFWICKKSAASCSGDEERLLSPTPTTPNPPPE